MATPTPSPTLKNLKDPFGLAALRAGVAMPTKFTWPAFWAMLAEMGEERDEGGADPEPTPTPVLTDYQRRDALAQQGPPMFRITGGWAPADADEIIVGVQGLLPNGSPFNRAFTLVALLQNGEGAGRLGLGAFGNLDPDNTPFQPERGCYREFRIPILQVGNVGHFRLLLGWCEDGFNKQGVATIVIPVRYGGEQPVDFAPLDRPANWRAALPIVPVPKTPALLDTDFIDGFKVTRDGGPDSFAGPTGDGTINGALGIFTVHGETRTRSGRLVDALPIIDGVRHLAIDDCQGDQVNDGRGRPYDFAMGFLSTRNRVEVPYGFFTLRTAYARVPGIDNAWWRMPLYERPAAYREHDHNEQFGDKGIPRWAINQHRGVGGFRGPQQSHQPLLHLPAGTIVDHKVLIEPDRIRTWIDDTLTDDVFNLMDDDPMYHLFLLEGWGGEAAGIPIGDYRTRQVRAPLHRFTAHAL